MAEIKALVREIKDIVSVLADADPEDKRAIYDELGVNLTHHPHDNPGWLAPIVVSVESMRAHRFGEFVYLQAPAAALSPSFPPPGSPHCRTRISPAGGMRTSSVSRRRGQTGFATSSRRSRRGDHCPRR
jgi:hypothetical protein